jgi:DNA modification methylase
VTKLPSPFFEDEFVTLYNGDARELLPAIQGDAVVTDPPYGIGFAYRSYEDGIEEWYELMNDVVPICQEAARFVVMPCSGIDRLGWWYANHPPDWLIAWSKGSPGQLSPIGFSAWEAHLCWGKPAARMHDHFKTRCGFAIDGHPCPKPIEWAHWLVQRAAALGGVVIDPFAGSGTTLRAAKDLGRRSVGIELDETYCGIAAERLCQEVLDLGEAA